jgi:hypothetical protein
MFHQTAARVNVSGKVKIYSRMRSQVKKRLMLVIVLSVMLNAVPGGAGVLSAQEAPVAGGYSEAPRTDRDVIAAAQFAIAKESRKKGVRVTLVSIEHAERQVVAGLNYKLCLKVKVKGKTQNVTTIVYQNLKQKYSLTSWEKDDCKERS